MFPNQKYLLLATVFITGAAVLVIEIAGVRLLAPYYGSSLPVISSVITVVLLALSLGYYWGGRLADYSPKPTTLMAVLASAGLLLLLVIMMAVMLLPMVAPALGLQFGPLVLAVAFYFLPALLLGIDSPFVIKLLTMRETSDTAGAMVGTVFFWSTIGSITGSLSTGFFLIPYIGLIAGMAYTALFLTVWTSMLWWRTGKQTTQRLIVAGTSVVIALVSTIFVVSYHSSSTGKALLYSTDGLYSHIEVFERTINGTTYRFLKNDTNHSSAIIPGSNQIVFPYAQYAVLTEKMVPTPRNYLALGGGAFTVPRYVHALYPNIPIDTVEMEPQLLPIAYDYFELPVSENLHHYTVDARVFLQSTTTQYDVIFSDVMNSGHFIPAHLSTSEFFAAVKDRLSPEGVAIFNYIGSLDTYGTSMTGSLIKTIKTVFPNLAIIPVSNPHDSGMQNILFVARHEGQEIIFPDVTITHSIAGYSFSANSRYITIPESALVDDVIFTDDKQPVEPLIAKQFRLHGQ